MKRNDKGLADWNLWADMEQAEIWEAVALSLDIEPNSLPGLDFRPIVGGPFDDCPDEFKRRLKLAVSKFDGANTKIRLSSLRKWAEHLTRAWTFPDEFPPKPAATHESPAPAHSPATPAPVETVEQRRTRYLAWHSEEHRISPRGALQRVYEREAKQNPKADRANIGKDIKKARVTEKTQKLAKGWTAQLVTDGKRQY